MSDESSIQDIVYALAASPGFARDGICFAARTLGLFRSDDGGQSWRSVYDSLNLSAPLATTAVVLSPDFEADRTVVAGMSGGFLRSTDGGESWQAVLLPSPPPLVSTLAISPDFVQDGVLLAGTIEDGVFRSADRASRWFPWNFGLLDLNILSLALSPDFARDETVLVGTDSGIFRSTNGGRAWREVPLPVGFTPVTSLALSPGYAGDGIIFAGTEADGLFFSGDRGRTWTALGGTELTDMVNAIYLPPEFPARPELLVMLGETLLVSRDSGQTWSTWPGLAGRLPEGATLSALAAPLGLGPDAPLLLGLVGGEVLRI